MNCNLEISELYFNMLINFIASFIMVHLTHWEEIDNNAHSLLIWLK